MLKTVFFIKLIMSSLLIIMLFLVAQFVPTIDDFLFGQPKLECKPCICHPECHCETKCVQQQILKECNLGVDSDNVFASHYTQENRTTRFILIFSLILNFFLTLLLLFRKPFRNCYRSHQNVKQQATARQNTEHYNIALKQMIAPQADRNTPILIQPRLNLIAIALQLELRRPRLNHY
jgi:hypothetical protein